MDGGVTRFGQVEFDAARGRLSVAGRRIALDRPCVAILSILLNETDKGVDKDRLLEAGWPGRVVHENSLAKAIGRLRKALGRSEEHTSELQSLMRLSYAVFCLKKKQTQQ